MKHFLLLAVTVLSTNVSAENLLQVYQHAKAYDPQLLGLEDNFRSVQEGVVQANSALKPQVSLSAGSTLSMTDVSQSISSNGNTQSVDSNYVVSLNHSLYNKTLTTQASKTKASVAQAKALLENEKQNLFIRTAQGYFNILLNQENLTFAQSEKVAIGKQLEQVKAHFEAGILAITDVKETQSRHDAASAQVIASSNQLKLAKEGLRVITGRNYKQLSGSANHIKMSKPNPANIDSWVSLAKKNNQQILSAEHAIDVSKKDLEQQRSLRKPTVNLVVSHRGAFTKDIVDDVLDSNRYGNSIGVQLNMPLYTGGLNSSKIRQARHGLNQSGHELNLQTQLVEQQVRSAYLTVISDISRVQSLKQALSSSQAALEATQAGFEVGTRTAVDVLLSLRNVFSAKRDYASAKYNYLLNMLSLKQAAGTISEKDLKLAAASLGK